ncbi:MAG: hypothetical protein LBE83_04625, partial [Propionibacteriaceae bacterium]|nr:hypothetical protein [Propionibacteriaceae bacterium]
MTKKHFSRAESQQLWRRLARWLMATAVGLVSSIVVVAGAPPASADEILTCQFGTGQVFDVQWDITGSTLLVSGMDYPFSNFNMFAPTPPPTRFDSTTLNETDYFQFFASTTVPGTLGLAVYSVDGTLRGVINETGSFEALGDGFLFYNGSSSWGTLLTTQEGFVYGDAATFAVTNDAPTEADVLAYQGCSAFPITVPVILDGTPPSGTVSQTYPGFTV